VRKHRGICVPVFSLKTSASCGNGEFLDLIPLLNWCKDIDIDVVQLLPLNETGPDASPFSAISSFALNPMFISITSLPHQELSTAEMKSIIGELKALNQDSHVDWHRVRALKAKWLRQYYAQLQVHGIIDSDAAFQEFTVQNKGWLPSYAIFCHLREKYKAANGNPLHWKDWDEQLLLPGETDRSRETAAQAAGPTAATPESPSRMRRLAMTPKTLRATPVAPASGSSPAAPSSPAPPPLLQRRITPSSLSDHFPRLSNQPTSFRIKRGARFFKFEDLFAVYGPRVGVYYYIQYLAYRQMLLVKQHANTLGIFLMGDIPFLVAPDSADVWQRRDEFRLTQSVGAPPDAFSAEGQDWGLPLYNWAKMEQNNYSWWRSRLAMASRIYDIYRIDHIVGFFRVWAIPNGAQPTKGAWEPADENLWYDQGAKLLSTLTSGVPMLPVGEDLGVVPNRVREIMHDLGICGTKVQRWERKWELPDQPFTAYKDYPLDSLSCVSTHDTETLGQWWILHPDEAVAWCRFRGVNYTPNAPLTDETRKTLLHDSMSVPSLFCVNLLSELLRLVPTLSPPDDQMDRINVPGTVSRSNWSVRLKPSVQQIADNDELRAKLAEIRSKP